MKIEKEIADLSEKYIFNETTASLLLLLSSAMEQKTDEERISAIYNSFGELKEIRNKISSYTFSLDTILLDSTLKNEAMNDCVETKERLKYIYEIISACSTKIVGYYSAYKDEEVLRELRGNNEYKNKSVEVTGFINDCADYLNSAESLTEMKMCMGELFSIVPFKMAREKYFSLMEESLKMSFENASENEVNFVLSKFKTVIAPELSEKYDIVPSEIKEIIDVYKDIKPADLDDDKLNDEIEALGETMDFINSIEDCIQLLSSDLNSLIILFHLGYNLDELSEENYEYTDMFYKTREVVNEKGEGAFDEIIIEKLDNLIEASLDKANDLNKKIMKKLQKTNDISSFSEDTLKIISTEIFIRSCFYEELSEEIFNYNPADENEVPAEGIYIDEKVSAFIKFVKEYLLSLSASLRKITIQRFLSAIPLSMSVEDVKDYIKSGLDNCGSSEEKILILQKAAVIFGEAGMLDDDEEDDFDDCGCGHDHHHHDDCGCGHDHHHHDDCGCGHDHH